MPRVFSKVAADATKKCLSSRPDGIREWAISLIPRTHPSVLAALPSRKRFRGEIARLPGEGIKEFSDWKEQYAN
jgi:hypothetical protein